jgi:hypothetical protein
LGKKRIRVAVVCFVLGMSIVVLVLVGGEGSRRGEVTVSGETPVRYEFPPADREREDPVWLRDYRSHVPLIGVLVAPSDVIEPVESHPLMDSFSPGVRASLEDAGLAPAWASARQREREEAEYRAFVEERMGRLSEGRSLAD